MAIIEQVKAIIIDQLGVDEEDVQMEASFVDDLVTPWILLNL